MQRLKNSGQSKYYGLDSQFLGIFQSSLFFGRY